MQVDNYFCSTNNASPDKMPHSVEFHVCLHKVIRHKWGNNLCDNNITCFSISYGLCHKKTFLVCNTNLSVQLLRLARLMRI